MERKEKAERLKEVCDYLKQEALVKNNAELSRALGYKLTSSFAHVLKGSVPISSKLLSKMAMSYPRINANWIATGEGEMLLSGSGGQVSAGKSINRFVKYLYAENIRIGDALKRLGWGRREYDKAIRSDLTRDQVNEIERTFENLNMEWLVYGTGNMIRVAPENIFSVLKRMQGEIEALRAKVNKLEKEIKGKL